MSLVGPSEVKKNATFLQVARKWNLSTKIWQNLIFPSLPQPPYNIMQNEIEDVEFVQGVNLEFIDSL